MINGFVIVAITTYVVMLIAFFSARFRPFHMPVMVSVMLFDLCVPFYLFLTRDWKARLIDSGDIMSFGVWMHFGLVLSLYFIYIVQIQSAHQLLRGSIEAKGAHSGQGKAILLVRALVIVTGAMLIPSDQTSG